MLERTLAQRAGAAERFQNEERTQAMLSGIWSKLSSRGGAAKNEAAPVVSQPSTPRGVLGRPLLGPTLVELGKITEEQLEAALELHRNRGIRLGAALCELGYCEQEDVVRGLARQHDMPFVSLKTPPAWGILRKLPTRVARELGAVPAHRDAQGRLVIVARDPLNIHLDGKLRAELDVPFVIAWGVRDDIDRVLAYYDQLNKPSSGQPGFPGQEGEATLDQIRRTLSEIHRP
jgi:hypothetical protein